MHRFFLPGEYIEEDIVRFPRDAARQMSRVLRLRPGKTVIILDNWGNEYDVRITELDAKSGMGCVDACREAGGEPDTRVVLYVCLTRREKFEWILQKCTEVGAVGFVPLISERSLVRNRGEAMKKAERWKRIIQEAAEQSGRGKLPELSPIMEFNEAVLSASQEGILALMPWEGEETCSLRQALVPLQEKAKAGEEALSVSVLVGPEGGFSEGEVEYARKAGIVTVTLGSRILRMETAAVVVVSLILHEMGDMEGGLGSRGV